MRTTLTTGEIRTDQSAGTPDLDVGWRFVPVIRQMKRPIWRWIRGTTVSCRDGPAKRHLLHKQRPTHQRNKTARWWNSSRQQWLYRRSPTDEVTGSTWDSLMEAWKGEKVNSGAKTKIEIKMRRAAKHRLAKMQAQMNGMERPREHLRNLQYLARSRLGYFASSCFTVSDHWSEKPVEI